MAATTTELLPSTANESGRSAVSWGAIVGGALVAACGAGRVSRRPAADSVGRCS